MAANDPVWENDAPMRIGGASTRGPAPSESPVATTAAMSAADLLIALIPSRSALAPRGRGEARLHRRQLLGPDDDLLAVLPLEHQQLVGDLEAVPVYFEGAKDRVEIHLQDDVPHLLALQGACALDGLQQDLAARITGGRDRGEFRTRELLLVGLHELSGPRILAGDGDQPAGPERHQLRIPPERAVD